MGFLSFLRRSRRTGTASYTSYKSARPSSRKPFKPKIAPLYQTERTSSRRGEKKGRLGLFLKCFSFLILIAGLMYVIFFTNWFNIQSIDIKGEADTLEEQAALNTYLQEYIGGNLISFNPLEHEAILLEKYAYLKTLDIDRDFFHTISVTLKTYPPVANVRIDFEDGSSQFYMVNEKGLVAGTGNSEAALPMIVMDVTGTDMRIAVEDETPSETQLETPAAESFSPASVELNEELIPEDILATLLETAKSYEGKFNMQVLEIYYLKQAREIHLYTERYFFVWIDMTQDIALQLAKLKKTLTELNIYELPLEYIDLRISGQNGEKVIYRLSDI